MPRRPPHLPIGVPVHVIQRGNNRQICFTSDEDMGAYLSWMHEAATRCGVLVHAWVLMTNHVHWLVTPMREYGVSRCIQHVGRHYVRFFNDRYSRTGTLFEGRFKAHPVQTSEYLLRCMQYIELNPVRAGMAADPAEYRWSSYVAHALGKEPEMWTAHDEYHRLGSSKSARQIAYRRLFEDDLDRTLISEIKHAQETGFVLGTERFRQEYEALTGEHQRYRKRGPKPDLGSE